MGEVYHVDSRGPLPAFKIGVADASGELLWAANPFFLQTYGETSRQFLKVLDKSDASVRSVYKERLGVDAPPKLAATCLNQQKSIGFGLVSLFSLDFSCIQMPI